MSKALTDRQRIRERNAQINERRQRRAREQAGVAEEAGPNLAVESIPLTEPWPALISHPTTERLRTFPTRDLEPVHCYKMEMWDTIHAYFNGEPKVAVEVGSRRGAFASGLMANTVNTRLFCIDTWAGRQGFSNFGGWLKRVEPWLARRVFPLRGTSAEWAKIIPFEFDLVFIDGSHDYDSAYFDFRVWWDLLSRDGLLIGHDYHQKDVQKAALDFWRAELGIEELDFFGSGPQKGVSFVVRKS